MPSTDLKALLMAVHSDSFTRAVITPRFTGIRVVIGITTKLNLRKAAVADEVEAACGALSKVKARTLRELARR